jgi:Fe-S cluster assembly ATP-binding protein
VLEIRNLHVNVESKEILGGVNLSIPNGEVHVLFGPNGSGKTTLMMTIIGYPEYKVTKGQILFDGKNISELDITERAKLGIGVSQQRPPTIKGVKLRQILDFFTRLNPSKKDYLNAMVKKFGISKYLDRDINSGFSGGEIKRSELFQILITLPKFLMLDEPDSGVDPEQLAIIGDVVNECLKIKNNVKHKIERNTGLIITHSGNILNYIHTDKAHLLLDGVIHCSGNPGLMLDQIKKAGYNYCISCQKSCYDHMQEGN